MTAMPSKIGWRPNDRCSIKVSPRLRFRGALQLREADPVG
jgi:hypothetical protein